MALGGVTLDFHDTLKCIASFFFQFLTPPKINIEPEKNGLEMFGR